MRKILLILVFLWIKISLGQENFIERHSQKLAKKIIETIKQEKIPINKMKISVMPFSLQNSENDSIYGRYSVELLHNLIKSLQDQARTEGLRITILPTDTNIVKQIIQQGELQSLAPQQYWEKVKISSQPNYYITGNYDLDLKEYKFITKNVSIIRNIALQQKQWNVEDIETPLNQQDREKIITDNTFSSLDGIARDIRFYLTNLTEKIDRLKIYPIIYQSTGTPTELSLLMSNLLLTELTKIKNIKITSAINENIVPTRGLFSKDFSELTGNYIIGEKNIIFNFQIKNSKQIIIFSQTYYCPLKNIKVNYKPQDEQNIITTNEQLKKEPLKKDFKIDITTNKGNKNLLFTEGEQVQFYIYSEEPAYIRIIDKTQAGIVMFVWEGYIDSSQTNQYINIGSSTVVPPFGTDIILMQAQTQKFKPLRTQTNEDGAVIILDNIFNLKNRGLTPSSKKAEKELKITTVPKNN